ncbi:hypothetical protein [Acinetobacter sp. ANC 4640]
MLETELIASYTENDFFIEKSSYGDIAIKLVFSLIWLVYTTHAKRKIMRNIVAKIKKYNKSSGKNDMKNILQQHDIILFDTIGIICNGYG